MRFAVATLLFAATALAAPAPAFAQTPPPPATAGARTPEAQALKALFAEELGAVLQVRRVISTEDRPIAYLVDTLPEEVMRASDLTSDFRGSVLDTLLRRGDILKTSRANITALNAAVEVAKALEIQRDDVLLSFSAQLFDENGKVVDYSLSYFIPGYFHFHVVRRVGS